MAKHRVESWRKPATVFVTVFWLLAASVIESRWGEHSLFGIVLLAIGFLLTGIGVLGRVWCLSYIAGRKTEELVTHGPYSLCRNPLYFFSLTGAIGVGLGTGTLTFPILVMLGFAAYYPAVMKSESQRLREEHHDAYDAYLKSTPALWPAVSKFRDIEAITINSKPFRRGTFDTFWFFGALALMHIFAELHHIEFLPTLIRLP